MSNNPPKFSDPNLPLAVVVAETRWNEAPRMRHQVVRQLMRWYNVLYVEFFPVEKVGQAHIDYQCIGDRLVVYHPRPCRVPIRLYANELISHHITNRHYRNLILEAVGSFKCPGPILINFVHYFPELMQADLFSYKMYVCVDEFPRMWRRSTQPFGPKYWYQSNLHQHYENVVARNANRCLATHVPLQQKLARVNRKTDLFYHGHEFHSYPNIAFNGSPGGHIKVGFMGYLTYRLLNDWLWTILNNESMELYLIGPLTNLDAKPFLARKNFVHVPPLTGEPLLRKLSEMDVLVQPYDPLMPENYVQTVSNKFFQYLASGRPVVISDMPYYIEMPNGIIYRAKTAAEFLEKIRSAKKEDCPEFVKLRTQIAQENTWEKRGDSLYSIIQTDLHILGRK